MPVCGRRSSCCHVTPSCSFVSVCVGSSPSSFGLTVSATKTKFMVTGDSITSADIAPLAVSSMLINHVPTFRYIGCNITNDGRCCADVKFSGQQRSAPTPSPTPASSASLLCLKCRFHCHVCNRCVLSVPGVKRHRCSRGTRANTAQRASFDNVCDCGRQFKQPQDLQHHRPCCSEPAQSHVGSA